MIAVADASPLHYLMLIEQVALLPALYRQVIIPHEVREELQHQETPETVRVWMHHPPLWLDIRPSPPEYDPGLLRLGKGERQAILLAQAIGADVLLIDERNGRREARSRGLHTVGTLGTLDEEAARTLVDLPIALARLQATTFYGPPELFEVILARDTERRRQQNEH
jgi:predicted nucleic acid-binding protein